jgi:hypothetical protein
MRAKPLALTGLDVRLILSGVDARSAGSRRHPLVVLTFDELRVSGDCRYAVRMNRVIGLLALIGVVLLSSCAKTETPAEPAKAAAEAPAAAPAAPPPGGPHAVVNLTDGSKVPGSIVASTQTDMVVAGDDGIERKIPLEKVKSVDYTAARRTGQAVAPVKNPAAAPAPAPKAETERAAAPPPPAPAPAAAPATPPPTTKTNELPAGAEVSVRTNELIDSGVAQEGQTFDAQVTRDLKDADGDIVVPRGSRADIVIKSASKGGKFRGQSDLVLDLQSVVINGKSYAVETAEIAQKGKEGFGANKRTAVHTGGGAAIGAIIGAIAGGGKGAAIGAGAGAGAGAAAQVLTKGGAIKVPAESVLTFSLDRALKVRVTD